MAGLQLKVTPAGRAALVNAANTGTLPVTVAQIGVTATAFDPATNPATLPGELKRLATLAGQVVADDTIHVTLRDDSDDTYSLRGFALYLADGTLFALYGQTGVILEKSTSAMLLLSADVKFADIAATSITFGDASFTNPPASQTVAGVTQFATNAEGLTGTADNRSIAASVLKYVLDSRFGVGAPSAFVKGLLTLTTAAALRLSLELKGAALKDEGAGNGLDADLLDGQHGGHYLAWGNLTGKPDAFTPAAHGHAWTEVSGAPETATRWPAWGEVTGKPTTFAPSAHSHDAGAIVTGTLNLDRIPALPISRVTDLSASLASKVSKAGDAMTGDLSIQKGVATLTMISASGAAGVGRGYRLLSNVADSVDFGLQFDRWTGSAWQTKALLNNAGFSVSGQMVATLANGAQYRATANGANFFDFGIGATTTDDPDAYLVNRANGAILFYTNNAERGRILATGPMVWNYTVVSPEFASSTSNEGLQFVWNSVGAGNGRNEYINNYGGGIGGHLFYVRASKAGGPTLLGGFVASGEFQAVGGFRNTSSRRVKDIEGPNPYGLDEVLKLETVVGSYKKEFNGGDGARRVFLVAENVAEHIDGPVRPMDGVEFEGEAVLGLDYQQLVPVLVRAVQELSAKVDALERRTRGGEPGML